MYGGTVLILPNWDHVAIPCPITGDASLTCGCQPIDLPGDLGENYTYVSGLDVQVKPSPDGDHHGGLPDAASRISDANLIILHWDGSQWVDRGGVADKRQLL